MTKEQKEFEKKRKRADEASKTAHIPDLEEKIKRHRKDKAQEIEAGKQLDQELTNEAWAKLAELAEKYTDEAVRGYDGFITALFAVLHMCELSQEALSRSLGGSIGKVPQLIYEKGVVKLSKPTLPESGTPLGIMHNVTFTDHDTLSIQSLSKSLRRRDGGEIPEALDDFFKHGINYWLKQHGYTPEKGGAYYNDAGDRLTKREFERLRDDDSNKMDLTSFLNGDFKHVTFEQDNEPQDDGGAPRP